MNLILIHWNMIMDCVIKYKNMMLIVKMKFKEFTLKLVHTDLRSQTTTVPPSNILDPSLPEIGLHCVLISRFSLQDKVIWVSE
jgi:hypothetical protein